MASIITASIRNEGNWDFTSVGPLKETVNHFMKRAITPDCDQSIKVAYFNLVLGKSPPMHQSRGIKERWLDPTLGKCLLDDCPNVTLATRLRVVYDCHSLQLWHLRWLHSLEVSGCNFLDLSSSQCGLVVFSVCTNLVRDFPVLL